MRPPRGRCGGSGRGDGGGRGRGRGGLGRGGRGDRGGAARRRGGGGRARGRGVAPLGVKTSFPKAEKNGRFSGRKALNAKKQQTGKAGGRKGLGDLNNFGKQPVRQASKKTQDKKLSAVAEYQIAGEYFHDHQKCIEARTAGLGLKAFVQIFGRELDQGTMQLPLRRFPRQ